MGTGIKYLKLFAQTNSSEQQLWKGIIFYEKTSAKNQKSPHEIALPLFRKTDCSLISPAPRIAVILHLYYTELWTEMAAFISQIPEPFDLYVTVIEKDFSKVEPEIKSLFPKVKVLVVENKGRDILPFLQVMETISPGRYEYICKIHSKKSKDRWWGDGEYWRRSLLGELLGSAETVQNILKRLDDDPRLGLVTAWGLLYNKPVKADFNVAKVKELSQRMGIEDISHYRFPAGTMFWVRQQALSPLLEIGLQSSDFTKEEGLNDGTLAHAVERLFCLSAEKAGFICEECPEFLA
jgi:lipopolysaccharide biosynthesis protein